MIPPVSPFRQAIDYRQSFAKPEPAIQRFNPLEKLAQMFQPRAPQSAPMMEPPSPPVPTAPPYGDPAQTMPRPRPMAGMMSGMADSGMPEILMALGAGISAGNLSAGSSMLPGLMERAAARKQYKKELTDSTQSRESLAQMLEQKGETDLAAGVRGGYIDPETAFDTYMKSLKEKQALENAPIKDEFGIERNRDGSFKNPYDEQRYNREKMKADLEQRKMEGELSKQQADIAKAEREQAEAAKKEAFNAPTGALPAPIANSFSTVYQKLGVDPETGADIDMDPNREGVQLGSKSASPVDQFISMIAPNATDRVTGFGSYLSVLPGTAAKDASEVANTLISEIITNEVAKLKAAGVSFGQITEFENRMFARLQGSLDLAQGREQAIKNLRLLEESMRRSAETGGLLFEDDPAAQAIMGGRPAAVAGTPPEAATMQQPPAQAPAQAPIEIRSEEEAMSLPVGTIVILNGRRFQVR